MHDHIVDERLGHLDEFKVEGNHAGAGAAAPAFLHGADA